MSNSRSSRRRHNTNQFCRRCVGVNPAAIAAGELAADQHRRNAGKSKRCVRVQRRGRYHMYRRNPMDDIASLLAMHAAHPRHEGLLTLHGVAA